jgi:hypothetical protein
MDVSLLRQVKPKDVFQEIVSMRRFAANPQRVHIVNHTPCEGTTKRLPSGNLNTAMENCHLLGGIPKPL